MDVLTAVWIELAETAIWPNKAKNEYEHLQAEQELDTSRLYETLNKEQRKMLLTLEARNNAIFGLEEEVMFKHGFRLGAQFMLDILSTSI